MGSRFLDQQELFTPAVVVRKVTVHQREQILHLDLAHLSPATIVLNRTQYSLVMQTTIALPSNVALRSR